MSEEITHKRKADGVTLDRVSLTTLAIAASVVAAFYLADRGDNKKFQNDMTKLATGLIQQQATTHADVQSNARVMDRISVEQKELQTVVHRNSARLIRSCERAKKYWPDHSGKCL